MFEYLTKEYWNRLRATLTRGEEIPGHHKTQFICTSCPGDPLHSGHINCIRDGWVWGQQHAKALCDQGQPTAVMNIVIVNADSFLLRKKGYYLLPQEERATVIGNLKWVDFALIWESPTGSQKVHEALEIIRPDAFYKGGDVKNHNFQGEERDVCDKLGIKLMFGMGGDKSASSSDYFAEAITRLGDRALDPSGLKGRPRA